MLTIEELHAHYRAVRARISDTSKLKQEKSFEPPPKAEPVVIEFKEPTFINPPDQIIYRVAKSHGVSFADIKGNSRKQMYVLARQEAAYRLRTERGLTLQQIGKLLGHKDHTTILHAIKTHEKRLIERTATLDEPSSVSSAL
jgi:chromosomal replication initiation ATPase DnaA